MKKILNLSFLILLVALMGCQNREDVKNKFGGKTRDEREDIKNEERLFGEPIFVLNKKQGEEDKDSLGIGVNAYLWRASLDTFSFMPFETIEPFSGVITTDWYSPPDRPDERLKVNILIRDLQLRADGVKISLFHQKYDEKKGWVTLPVSEESVEELEQTVLTRARQLKIESSIK